MPYISQKDLADFLAKEGHKHKTGNVCLFDSLPKCIIGSTLVCHCNKCGDKNGSKQQVSNV